jgi:hypothetical protein
MNPNNPTIELVDTEWFDPNAIRLPNYKVGRINYGNGRSYVGITDGQLDTPFKLYTSLTTAINSCAPMERGLLEWYCKLGIVEADRYLVLTQHYGTLMHMLIGDFLKTNTFDFEEVESRVQAYLSEKNYFQPECNHWAGNLKYDVAAFIKFSKDYKIIPLGIEYVLLSKRGYGTMIDLVCKMTIEEKGFFGEVYKTDAVHGKKGDPKESKRQREVTAVINFKSGRHSFYRSNGIQIECERQLWEENFPDIPVERCFNWSPKDWIISPDYNLRDWTGEITQAEIDAILQLADIRYASKAMDKKYVTIGGQYYSTRSLDECVKVTPVDQWAANKYSTLMGEIPVVKATGE